MKKFLLNAFVAALCCAISAATMLACKIAKGQKAAKTAFALPPGTETLHIGNSHTGCSFVEDPKFRNRVIYTPAAPFQTAAVTFLELDRLGYLDGVKLCTMDFDIVTMSYSANYETLSKHWRETMAYSAEDIRLFPQSHITLWVQAGTMIGWPTEFGKAKFSGTGHSATTVWLSQPDKTRKNHISRRFPRDKYGNVVPLHIDSMQKESLLASLRAVKEVCDKRGIELLLFASPLSEDDPGRTHPDLYRECAELVSEIRAMGVAYADFSTTCPDSMFLNSDHLHEEGAEKFTEAFFDAIAKLPPCRGQDAGKDADKRVWAMVCGRAIQSCVTQSLPGNTGAGGAVQGTGKR